MNKLIALTLAVGTMLAIDGLVIDRALAAGCAYVYDDAEEIANCIEDEAEERALELDLQLEEQASRMDDLEQQLDDIGDE